MKRVLETGDVCIPDRVTIEPTSVRLPFQVNKLPSDAVIVDKIRHYHGMVDVVASMLGVSCEVLTERISGREDFALEIRLAKERLNARKKLALADALYRGDLSAMSLELARQKVEQDRAGSGGGSDGAPIDFTREVESVKDMTDAEIDALLMRDLTKWDRESGKPCPVCGHVHEANTNTKGKE